MQRRLGVRAEPAMGVHISASGNQTLHDRRTVRKVTRPVRGGMQQGPIGIPSADASRGQPWIRTEQPVERIKIASLDGLGGRNRARIIGGHETNGVFII
jgi:hypothetical protein